MVDARGADHTWSKKKSKGEISGARADEMKTKDGK